MGWFRRFTRWALRRQPRMVCIHMKAGEPSVTGFLIGRWSGCYVLAIARVLDEKTGAPSDPLEGQFAIPAGNVFAVQHLVAVAP